MGGGGRGKSNCCCALASGEPWQANCILQGIPDTNSKGMTMTQLLRRLWSDDTAQDVAEYAVMLAVVLTITVMTVRLIGENSNNVFSEIGSKLS